ncbi:hypothetical protein HPB49_010119 [Dermacentor silvarum]|uniref:Uncharacterized protein n=1 Tax=Dermacentor silvarum TaxID=543639 RepID=A0ACB8CWT0_DERSI|nr:hypothetical protein HPB49_010119 [Dermacentor silvarum]
MDSAPSEQRDCTALLAPIEARLSNLEGQMASIVTTIEDRLAAAIQTVFDRIPAMIVAQLPQIVSSTRRPTTKLKLDPLGPAYSYAGTENADLDRCFQLHDLKAALSKMKRGTAPGRDRVTVRLLANLPDSAYLHLLDYFNQTWEGLLRRIGPEMVKLLLRS